MKKVCMSKLLGGWSMSLTRYPLNEFDYIMYGMVTNLEELTTGSMTSQGWSPEHEPKPEYNPCFTGKRLWVYGGGGCTPEEKPSSMNDVSRIISTTINNGWDGVDFDDECNMNTAFVIETMKMLKKNNKETSFGFIAGYSYNNPNTEKGKKITDKVKAIIASGQCDRLVHYCYAAAMWNQDDIINNVKQALVQSISYGIEQDKIVLALTTVGLTDWNLNYFLDQIIDLNLGGVFIWRYDELTPNHYRIIKERLNKS
ncbi:hypothetical protein [Rickettsia endosymbiont of Lasioglossum villosulum]|uniref:hypothetical protein n=1 Tax=Rickettsia endosymbiont of Lasioglossum villosulum TaxID=3066269 RepID=UPI003133060B